MSEPKINSLDDISNLVRALRDYEKNKGNLIQENRLPLFLWCDL